MADEETLLNVVDVSSADIERISDAVSEFIADKIEECVDPDAECADIQAFALLVAVVLSTMLRLLRSDPATAYQNLELFCGIIKESLADENSEYITMH